MYKKRMVICMRNGTVYKPQSQTAPSSRNRLRPVQKKYRVNTLLAIIVA